MSILGKIDYERLSIQLELVDADRATELLKNNSDNRNLSDAVAARYVRAMVGDRWKFVGDPIRISTSGRLLDGQHRLEAIQRSGVAQPMLLVIGLDDAAQLVMDQGALRRAGQQLQMLGYRQGNLLAAIAALAISQENGTLGEKTTVLSNDERVDYVDRHAEGLAFAIDRVTDARKFKLPIAPSVLGVAALQLHGKAEPTNIELEMDSLDGSGPLDVWRVAWFFSVLGSGFGLAQGSPILLLRNWALRTFSERKRFSQLEQLYYLTRCWNAWRAGETLGKLQQPRGGEITSDHLVMS